MKIYAIYGFTPYENSNDVMALFLHREVAERELKTVVRDFATKGESYENYGVEEYEVSEAQV
jgi:hypothetical protein